MVFLTCREKFWFFLLRFKCVWLFEAIPPLYRVFCDFNKFEKNREKMSNFPPNDSDQVNRPGPYSPSNYGGTSQPGPFNSRYGAPAPGQYQPQPLDPKQQQMQEFIVGAFSFQTNKIQFFLNSFHWYFSPCFSS